MFIRDIDLYNRRLFIRVLGGYGFIKLNYNLFEMFVLLYICKLNIYV